jgi:hypothetical protein
MDSLHDRITDQITKSLEKHKVTFFAEVAKHRLMKEVAETLENKWKQVQENFGDGTDQQRKKARQQHEEYVLKKVDEFLAVAKSRYDEGETEVLDKYVTGVEKHWTPTGYKEVRLEDQDHRSNAG